MKLEFKMMLIRCFFTVAILGLAAQSFLCEPRDNLSQRVFVVSFTGSIALATLRECKVPTTLPAERVKRAE